MGHRIVRAPDGDWPVLLRDGGSVAEGEIFELTDPTAMDRMDWYEALFGYARREVTVSVGARETDCWVYDSGARGGSETSWDLASWVASHGEMTRLAAEEILRLHGRSTPEAAAPRYRYARARAHSRVMAAAYRRPATIGGDLTSSDVESIDVVRPYEGFHAVEERRFAFRRFDGTISEPVTRAVSVVTQAATVLPYDPVRERVLVVEQVRAGAVALGDPLPWMLEPVAGLIDPGEGPEETVLREAREEAGITLRELRFVARYYPSPGGLAQILHSYIGLCDLSDGTEGLGGLDDEAEDIRSHLLPLDRLIDMISTGEAANAPLILSAQWLALNRAGLT